MSLERRMTSKWRDPQTPRDPEGAIIFVSALLLLCIAEKSLTHLGIGAKGD